MEINILLFCCRSDALARHAYGTMLWDAWKAMLCCAIQCYRYNAIISKSRNREGVVVFVSNRQNSSRPAPTAVQRA